MCNTFPVLSVSGGRGAPGFSGEDGDTGQLNSPAGHTTDPQEPCEGPAGKCVETRADPPYYLSSASD